MNENNEPLLNPLDDPQDIHLIVLTGMSGGGKTVALRALEDLEFYCVDNLPSALLPQLVNAVIQERRGKRRRIAVGVDVRNRGTDFAHMPAVLSGLAAAGVQVHLIFLDCRDEVLIKRYSETRRRHPLATRGLSLADAIAEERRLLRPLMAIAEKVIDSSELNVHQLRRLVATGYAQATEGLTLMFQSFAFRRGLPLDADFVFDARCLPNPHWQPHLRPLSGKDAPVREFLDHEPMVGEYYADTVRWLDTWLPRFEQDDRSYMTISIGCTGGRHRSVYLVEKLAAYYRDRREGVLTFHRELE
ncbi:MAG: RNase adapter RapZ [Rhodanobacter sp.]